MDDAISRFNKRKQILSDNKGIKIVHIADQTMVESFLSSPIDYQSVERVSSNLSFKLNLDLAVTDQEIHALLKTIEDKYDSEKFDNLFNACKDTVLASIAGPFGLGKIVASQDKGGGNVSTVHNAKEGVFANEEDQENFSSYNEPFVRNNWDDKKERGKHYERINRALDAGEIVKDDYTNGNLEKGSYDQDHVTPLNRLHNKASLHLYYSEEERKKIANSPSNLAATDSDLNRHGKRAKTNCETINNQAIVDKYDASKVKMVAAQVKSESAITIKTSCEVGKRVAETGVNEGAKMGLQQALGLLLAEFYQATFDEIKDIYKNGFTDGFEGSGFFQILKDRLSRIAKRIASKWENACEAFSSGFLSGFISNIATVLINSFYTTTKNLVRIIREGFFSLIKAIKILCDPPEGLSFRQAAHEASKIVAAGLIVTGGVLIEESIKAFVATIPVIGQFAGLLVPVLVGALTGLATTLVVYLIDKMDLFGAVARERHQFTMDLLEDDIDKKLIKANEMVEKINLQLSPISI